MQEGRSEADHAGLKLDLADGLAPGLLCGLARARYSSGVIVRGVRIGWPWLCCNITRRTSLTRGGLIGGGG